MQAETAVSFITSCACEDDVVRHGTIGGRPLDLSLWVASWRGLGTTAAFSLVLDHGLLGAKCWMLKQDHTYIRSTTLNQFQHTTLRTGRQVAPVPNLT